MLSPERNLSPRVRLDLIEFVQTIDLPGDCGLLLPLSWGDVHFEAERNIKSILCAVGGDLEKLL
jgi:hypothetical protein